MVLTVHNIVLQYHDVSNIKFMTLLLKNNEPINVVYRKWDVMFGLFYYL